MKIGRIGFVGENIQGKIKGNRNGQEMIGIRRKKLIKVENDLDFVFCTRSGLYIIFRDLTMNKLIRFLKDLMATENSRNLRLYDKLSKGTRNLTS